MIPTVSKIYSQVNNSKLSSYYDYESFEETWGIQDNYEIVRKIGRGKYSEVFEGINVLNNEKCCIKVLKPVKKKKIKREIKILQNLNGGPNIIKLYDIVQHEETNTPSLIMEYIENTEYRQLYSTFNSEDVKFYMYQLLMALDYSHSLGIMHRDIKPQNVVIDHTNHQLRIIDWGLGEFYHPQQDYNVRVASRCYKGPELLVGYLFYDYSLDLWSFGCMLAGIVLKKDPFFHGKDNSDQLVKIVKVLGTSEFLKYLKKYNITLQPPLDSLLSEKIYNGILLKNFQTVGNCNLATDEAIDLLEKLLKYDHMERLTAKEAMSHPYFDSIRKESKKFTSCHSDMITN